MKKLIGIVLIIMSFIISSCDDFFSPTIEIFNVLETEQKQKQKNEVDNEVGIEQREIELEVRR